MRLTPQTWQLLPGNSGFYHFLVILLNFYFISRRPGDGGGPGGPGSNSGGQPPQDPPGPRPDGPDSGDGAQALTSATNRSALNTPEPVPQDQEGEYLIPLVTIEEEVRVNRSAPPPSQPPVRNRVSRPVMTPRVRYYSERELQQLHNRAIHAHSTSSCYAGMFYFRF